MVNASEHPSGEKPEYPQEDQDATRRVAETLVAPVELSVTFAEEPVAISQERYLGLLQEYARRLLSAGVSQAERVLGQWHGDHVSVWTVVEDADWDLRDAIYRVQEDIWEANPQLAFDFRVIRRCGNSLDMLYGPLTEFTIVDLRGANAEPTRTPRVGFAQRGDAEPDLD